MNQPLNISLITTGKNGRGREGRKDDEDDCSLFISAAATVTVVAAEIDP